MLRCYNIIARKFKILWHQMNSKRKLNQTRINLTIITISIHWQTFWMIDTISELQKQLKLG